MNPDQVFALVLVTIFGVVVPFGSAWIVPAARARRLRFAERVVAGRDDRPELIAGGRS